MSGDATLEQLVLDGYTPFTFDYSTVAATSDGKEMSLDDWLQVFRSSVPSFKRQAIKGSPGQDKHELEQRAEDFGRRFEKVLQTLSQSPKADIGYDTGPYPTHTNCAALCRARDLCMQDAGFGDVFRHVKAQENSAALKLLPEVLQGFDNLQDPDARWELAVRGVFAGNIFDLGAAASEELFAAGGSSFQRTRESLQARPWVVDDLDMLVQRMRGQAHYKAVLFVDNAGSDVILGMIPFARELLRRGTRVIIAANEMPTINDITAEELLEIMPEVCSADPEVLGRTWKTGQLSIMHNGSDLPVIDLTRISKDLCREAADADLVVLEGMGRSIETNLRAKFRCDVINLGMIKHREVAALLGGALYGCVCRFEPGELHLPLWQNLIKVEGVCPEVEKLKASVVWPPVAQHFTTHSAMDKPGGSQDLLGEGPVWCQESELLYWVDIPRPAIHQLHILTGRHIVAGLSDWVGCIGLWGGPKPEVGGKRSAATREATAPELVAAVGPHLVGLTLPATETAQDSPMACKPAEETLLARVIPKDLQEHLCLNDGKLDAHGNLWLGSAHKPGSSLAAKAAPYRAVKGSTVPGALEIDPDGEPPLGSFYVARSAGITSNPGCSEALVAKVEEAGPVTVSNGLGWSPDNTVMYTTDSAARCVRSWDFDLAESKITRPRIFCGVPASLPSSAVPDGLTVDAAGNVWVAFWNGGAIGSYSGATGALRMLLHVPVSRPTCVTFGGAALDTLFVTSCRQDKCEDQDLTYISEAAEPLAGCVFAIHNVGPGLPSNRLAAV